MARVQVTEVDGVPAFWIDSGRPTLTAALVFRQGMVDESFASSGWTHLLEHLALHGRGGGTLSVNGEVSLLTTRLDVHGPADRVTQELASVSRWLADPDLSRLSHEQSVLRAESDVRGSGELSQALLWRYGAQGPGLAAYPELGLPCADDAALHELCATRFVRGNAALFLDGPPPAGLSLHLPDGTRNHLPDARPCGEVTPAAYEISSGIVVSGVVQRTVAATVLPAVLRELLMRELREREGGAYAPWAHYEAVDGERALVLAGSDANRALLGSLADRTLAQLTQVTVGSFDHSLVTDTLERMKQAFEDPYQIPGLAYRAAMDHLRGLPVQHLDEVLAELAQVSVDDVIEEARSVKATLLVGIDGSATWRQAIPVLGMPTSAARLGGQAYRSRNFPAYRGKLVVGPTGVQVGAGQAFREVTTDDVAGLLLYPDGGREVVSKDGWRICVEPTLWVKGRQATQTLDAMVPAHLHIPMPHRDPDVVPTPAGFGAKARSLYRDPGVRRAMVWFYLLFCVGLTVVGVVTFHLLPAVLGAAGAVRTGRSIVAARGTPVAAA